VNDLTFRFLMEYYLLKLYADGCVHYPMRNVIFMNEDYIIYDNDLDEVIYIDEVGDEIRMTDTKFSFKWDEVVAKLGLIRDE